MGNSFHTAMNDIVTDDSARMSGRDFSEARGAAVTRRVRTRRAVRAAGIGTVATASAGALAYTALQWDRAPQPAAPGEARCLPGVDAVDLPLMMRDNPTILSAGGGLGVGGEADSNGTFHYELTEERLTVSLQPPAEEIDFEIVDHQLIGPDGPTDDPFTVTFPSGRRVTLQLVWTDESAEVGFGLGDQMVFGSATGFPQAGPAIAPGTTAPEFLMLPFTGAVPEDFSGLLVDMSRGQVQAQIGIGQDGNVNVLFRDGSTARFDAGDDGLATFTWAGYGIVSIDPADDQRHLTSGVAVTAPVDATISGPVICETVVTEDPSSDGMQYIDLVDPEQPTD